MIPETGSNRRTKRCYNVAIELMLRCGGRHPIETLLVSAKHVRLSILKQLNEHPRDAHGDARAHGDSLFTLGLKRNPVGEIVFCRDAFVKCQSFLIEQLPTLLTEPHDVFKKVVPRLHSSTIDSVTVVVVAEIDKSGRYLVAVKSDSWHAYLSVNWATKKIVNVYSCSPISHVETVLDATLEKYFSQTLVANPSGKRLDIEEEEYISQGKKSPHLRRPHVALVHGEYKPRKSSLINKHLLTEESLAEQERFKRYWDNLFDRTLHAFGLIKSMNFEQFKQHLKLTFG